MGGAGPKSAGGKVDAIDGVDPELEPFTRRGAVEQARRYISNSIEFRRFKPGERLPSASELSERIGVSRPSVLAALKILADEGRLEVRPGRAGARVLQLDPGLLRARAWEKRDALSEMCILREILEPGLMRLAASEGLSQEMAAEARGLIERMRNADGHDDYLAADIEFHHLFGRALGRKIVETFAIVARRVVSPGLDIIELTADRRAASDSQHEQILNAVLAGDVEAAAEHSLRHVAASTALVREALIGVRPADAADHEQVQPPIGKANSGRRKRSK